MESIGKAIKTDTGYTFDKKYHIQGVIYKFVGDLNTIDDDYPIYQSEYEENDYETKATLKKMCKGTKVNWKFLFEMLDWAYAETTLDCLQEIYEENWFGFGDE